MRVLIIHNRYQQRGGEDTVVESESALLQRHGHFVEILLVDNDYIRGALSQISASLRSVYSFAGNRLVRAAIRRVDPDVIHIHNFFPTLSPSIFRVCREEGLPVVHTLHNYRTVCAASTLFRDGQICEECIEKQSMLPGVQYGCYRGSRIGSAVSGIDMLSHQYLGTWQNDITAYIALTPFVADKISTYRLPREKIYVKPNFSEDRGIGSGEGGYALFVGRLTPEKGVRTLLEADAASLLCMEVLLLGDGPLRAEVEAAAKRPGSRLRVRGFVDRAGILDCMQGARALILPSLWYEAGLPLVAIEALSTGLPIVSAHIANFASSLHPAISVLYKPGDPQGLALALEELHRSPDLPQMRLAARQEYLDRYTPEKNYMALRKIYEKAIEAVESKRALRQRTNLDNYLENDKPAYRNDLAC